MLKRDDLLMGHSLAWHKAVNCLTLTKEEREYWVKLVESAEDIIFMENPGMDFQTYSAEDLYSFGKTNGSYNGSRIAWATHIDRYYRPNDMIESSKLTPMHSSISVKLKTFYGL